MDISQLCAQQKAKEKKAIKFYLACGLTSSAIFHLFLVNNFNWLPKEKEKPIQEPIELVLVDTPKPEIKESVKEEKIEPEKTVIENNIPDPSSSQTESKPPTPVAQKPTPTPTPTPVVQKPTPTPTPTPVVQKPTPTPTPTPTPVVQKPTPTPTPTPTSQQTEQNSLESRSSDRQTNSNSEQESNPSSTSNGNDSNRVAANTGTVKKPKETSRGSRGLSCISNCTPQYPSVLNGNEGSAGVRVSVDTNGKVIGVQLARANPNFQINQQALNAARRMQFTSPGNQSATLVVNINFTVAGSDFHRKIQRQAELERQRQQQQQQRQAELERQRQQQQRQAELERQRQRQQQRQAELERQRQQQRQAELEQQRQQQQQRQAELERQKRIDEILKRNSRILNQE
ncbi:MAG: TonB family protein [Prochloraceae cyanobacterium]|nr:TonB family protein [Prochloraceae cyanobacterium]